MPSKHTELANALRLLVGVLVAPLATPLVFSIPILASEPRMSGLSAAIVFGFFALLFAYAATIVLGIPAYATLRDTAFGYGEASFVGAGIGFFTFFAYWLVAQPTPGAFRLLVFFVSAAAAGACSAALFLAIARPRRPTPRSS